METAAVAIGSLSFLDQLIDRFYQFKAWWNSPTLRFDNDSALELRRDVASARFQDSLRGLNSSQFNGNNEHLHGILRHIHSLLDTIEPTDDSARGGPSQTMQRPSKQKVQQTLTELERVQAIFDSFIISAERNGGLRNPREFPAYRDMELFHQHVNDHAGAHPVELRSVPLTGHPRVRVRYSTVCFVPSSLERERLRFVIERPDTHDDAIISENGIRRLAHALSVVQPSSMYMLRCHSFSQTELWFQIPDSLHQEPITLRERLIGPGGRPSVRPPAPQLIALLTRVAVALRAIHLTGSVHRQVWPNNVLLFSQAAEALHAPGPVDRPVDQAFLAGFSLMRDAHRGSERLIPTPITQCLYLPVALQGHRHDDREHTHWDDVYSFGVMALEVLLWTPFLVPATADESPMWDCNARLGLINGPRDVGRHEKFCGMAREDLPGIVGKPLADLVHDCLTCLDTGSSLKQKLRLMDRSNSSRDPYAMEYVCDQLLRLSVT